MFRSRSPISDVFSPDRGGPTLPRCSPSSAPLERACPPPGEPWGRAPRTVLDGPRPSPSIHCGGASAALHPPLRIHSARLRFQPWKALHNLVLLWRHKAHGFSRQVSALRGEVHTRETPLWGQVCTQVGMYWRPTGCECVLTGDPSPRTQSRSQAALSSIPHGPRGAGLFSTPLPRIRID